MSKQNTNRRWVNCPICDEPDMRFEPEMEDGKEVGGYLHCVNLGCPSNDLKSRETTRAYVERLAEAENLLETALLYLNTLSPISQNIARFLKKP